MLESKIERDACKAILKKFGIEGIKFSTPGHTGYPDRIFLCPGGLVVFIEFKHPVTGRVSKKQMFIITKLRKLGFRVEVCYSVEQAVEVFEKLEYEGLI